jgi:hypothetical protein
VGQLTSRALRASVRLLDNYAALIDSAARHDLETLEELDRVRAAVGLHATSSAPGTCSTLESLADAVATITGPPVNERLPDEVLLGADEPPPCFEPV